MDLNGWILGKALHQLFCKGGGHPALAEKMDPVRMGDQKDIIAMKNSVHWIKNQGETLFKMLQNSVKWQLLQILLKSYIILIYQL